MPRIEASQKLKQSVLERFGYQCAACDNESRLTVDVAHLYEDATFRAASLDRLIVLCSNCNQAQTRAKARSTPELSERLDAQQVRGTALKHYRSGNYPRAYAASRLAAYLFQRQKQYSKSVDCLVDAISALRPIRWGDLLAATILEIGRECEQHSIAPVSRWLFLDRLALVLYDYGRWSESLSVLLASQTLLKRIPTNPPQDPQQLEFDKKSSFRRYALICGSSGNLGGARLLSCIDHLVEDANEFLNAHQYDSFATNLDVVSKLAWEVIKDPGRAHKYVQAALDLKSKITHRWVLQEILLREGWYFFLRNDVEQARQRALEALAIYNETPVFLEPTLGKLGPVKHEVESDIQRLQMTAESLSAMGLACKQLIEVPLALTKAQIERITKKAL